ncbi:MAG: glycosyltransferase family 1 protein, partial [Proteobacteria bacterium]|nr:glycosyltransferase family 1 protein [Pseudomonadota bacterium]
MKILIATDAYFPQVNGVVRTLHETGEILKSQGHTIEYITPQLFLTFPMPKYNEIRLSVNVWPRVGNLIKQINPDAIHIATEGPIGAMARRYCIKNNLKFTTSFHTRFDKYLKLYFPIIPSKWAEKFLANFHNKAERILVTTETMRKELIDIGIDNKKMVTWTRGGNHGAFKNPNKIDLPHKRPIWIYVGRVAIEKNIRAFLELELEGTKIIIGKGPDLKKLKKE